MSNRFLFYIVLLLSLAGSATLFSQKHYRIVSQNENGIEILFEFPALSLSGAAESRVRRIEIPEMTLNYLPGQPLLPVLSLPLTLPECQPKLQVAVEAEESYPDIFPPVFMDAPNQPDKVSQPAENIELSPDQLLELSAAQGPAAIAELSPMGIFRDYKLTRLRILPVQVTPAGIRFHRKIRVKIRYQDVQPAYSGAAAGETALLKGLVANGEQLHLAKIQSPPVTTPQSATTPTQSLNRVKLIIRESGIYSITGKDLLDAKIDIRSMNPRSFRLLNKGRNVAIFVKGDQDGSFDETDFFEFWGERNEKTLVDRYPDLYTDPFSDNNVYWLEWESSPGLRMLEENGSIVSTRSGQFNPSLYYSHTAHIEQDRHFNRLGQANQEQLSYRRDLWFFDGGISAIGKRQYPFELIHPEPGSFSPVQVKVMMSGLSFDQVLGNERQPHRVMVWLNNAFVGESRDNWFDQDTASITTGSSSTIRAADLNHGENVLDVQLPSLPDVGNPNNPGKGSDIVLLNWFQVTYDRQYIAHENRIEFRRPAFIPFPNTDLFQFEIDNFTRPEIDIYKIGVSKIVNYKIDFDDIEGERIYKVTFQDNVPGDDVRYIALTADQKKKPLRILMDRPFDANAPERTLKSHANAAEYLIITHGTLFESARPLLEYRRGQGVAAELIDVQDIYDEFNHGIKSPLAIQHFLKYAFFNWNRSARLKYVLLLGGANLNYKSTDPGGEDLVPTFFYQTEKFGAAASDYPYALIAGEDQIPDLFIGRIPANTSADVASVTNKIIEYEQNAPKTAWRNQALFISGNDRSTYELSTQLGRLYPAFRSQNSRVIESILPGQQTGFRLNTVPDTGQGFDPNFGSTTDLIDHWDNGLFLINFMGHGGGAIWADEGLMQLSDVERLNNKGMYPFITSMTCFTGAFENPRRPGLSQRLVLVPDKGAIGAIASSGLGYLHNDYSLLWYTGQFLFDQRRSIGEIYTLGKILYYDTGGAYNFRGDLLTTQGFLTVKHEMVYQYNLIGDPYVKLQYTVENLPVELNTSNPLPGETLEITINSGLSNADGYVELVDKDYNIRERLPLFGVSGTATVTLPVSTDFPNGTGLVRAYLSDGVSDRSGAARIGVNHAVVQNIEFQPQQPAVDDTVTVNLRIADTEGIRRVYIFREGVKTDTIPAVPDPSDPQLYSARLRPTFELKTVFFNIYVENNAGNLSVIPNINYTVEDIRPDLRPIANTLEFGGRRHVRLSVGVENLAGAGNDGSLLVHVRFAEGQQNLRNGNYFATVSGMIGAADSATFSVRFPLPLHTETYDIYALTEVDAAAGFSDFNTRNDTVHAVLRPDVFNISALANDTLLIGERYRVYFPPASVSDSVAVRLREVAYEPPKDQSGLLPVHLQSPDTYHALEVTALDPGVAFNQPYQIRVQLDSAFIDLAQYNVTDVTLYEKNSPTQPWISTNFLANANNYEISAHLQSGGLFAPFVSNDRRAPQIELTVDGRPVRESGLVSNTPSLYVLIQDESGINLQRDKVRVTLNGSPVADDKLLFPDSLQSNNMLGLTIFPELSQGKHQLQIVSEDVNGNRNNASFELVVADGFDIIVYGNYPNPFSDQTIFSYFINLNDDLDAFEIRIYTISGRFIRRVDSDINNDPLDPDGGARRKGYNELIWDGTDNDGVAVANGVYFAVLRGTYQGETIEKILKVVKLR